LLENDGFTVIYSYSGYEGLYKYVTEKPDFIILDISKIEAGKMEMKKIQLDVAELAKQIIVDFEVVADDYVVKDPEYVDLIEAVGELVKEGS